MEKTITIDDHKEPDFNLKDKREQLDAFENDRERISRLLMRHLKEVLNGYELQSLTINLRENTDLINTTTTITIEIVDT